MANPSSRSNQSSPIVATPSTTMSLFSMHERDPYSMKIPIEDRPWKEVVIRPPTTRQLDYRRLVFRIVTIVLVGVIVGVGLSLGLAKRSSPGQQTATPSAPPTNASTAVGQPLSLYEGTYFAAFRESSGGARHVFFQAANTSIQHMVCPFASDIWSIEDLGLQNARTMTPLSALEMPGGLAYLFYVTTKNEVASIRRSTAGVWQNFPVTPAIQLPITADQLTADYIPSFEGDTADLHILLLTGYPAANVTLYHLSSQPSQSYFQANAISMAAPDAAFQIKTPCAATIAVTTSMIQPQYQSIFPHGDYYPWIAVCSSIYADPINFLVGITFDGTEFNSILFNNFTTSPSIPPGPSDISIVVINSQLSILRISGATMISSGGVVPSTNTNFPYGKMASLQDGENNLYLYHQLDQGTIGQAFSNSNLNFWQFANITKAV